jgi:hypothetical protein
MLDGEDQLDSSCRFALGERCAVTHWIGGLVGPRAALYAVEKKKLCPCQVSKPGRLSRRYFRSNTQITGP